MSSVISRFTFIGWSRIVVKGRTQLVTLSVFTLAKGLELGFSIVSFRTDPKPNETIGAVSWFL